MTDQHVALCFFGLTRSLKHTIKSIEKYIFNPLKANNIKYTVYLHTYQIKTPYSNPRAGEKDIALDPNEYKLLKPDHKLIEDKAAVVASLNLEKYRTMGDPWSKEKPATAPTDFTTLDNHILYLWSQKQLTQMALKHNPSHIVFCRPDVLYQTPLNPSWFSETNTICMPDFAVWHNVNDRFAIGPTKLMKIYGQRFDNALAYSKHKPLSSEAFLEDTLKKHKIKSTFIEFFFTRLRANKTKNPLNVAEIKNRTRKNKPQIESSQLRNYLQTTKDDWNYITPVEFYNKYYMKKKPYFLVDLRDKEAYNAGHVKGAINIFWLNILDPDNLKKLPKTEPIFLICYVGHTSSQILTLLKLLKYNVVSIKFGYGQSPVKGVPVAGWLNYGYPLVKD